MNHVNKLICALAITFITAPSSAKAQDFYNGYTGPRAFQLDNYIDTLKENVSASVILKFFPKNLSETLPNMILAVPHKISNNGFENKGVNLGYVFGDKNRSAIGAVGIFKSQNGKYRVLSPNVYFTEQLGAWTIDLEGSLAFEEHKIGGFGAATVGYGLNEKLRVGGSIIVEKDKSPRYQAITRLELTKDHKYWLEGYLKKDSLSTRLAVNF